MAVFSKMLQAQLGSRLGLAFGAGSLVIIGAVVRYLRQARAAQLRNKKLYVISKNKTKKERVAVNGAFLYAFFFFFFFFLLPLWLVA